MNAEATTTAATSSATVPDDPAFLLGLYERMVLIREFEDGVKFLFLEGSMPGTIHQCQGQEATAVGVCAALRESDFITSTFRGHGHALAKGLTVEEVLFELYGATTGCCPAMTSAQASPSLVALWASSMPPHTSPMA